MTTIIDLTRSGTVKIALVLLVAGAAQRPPVAGAATFTQRLVSTDASQAAGLVAADVDRDGDMDVITAEYAINAVAWYENTGGTPPGWTKHLIDPYASGPITVAAGDVDRDGDVDVFSANFNDEGIAWYENPGTPGAWTKRVISGYWVGAWGVNVADVDGDGDLDGIGGLTNTKCGPPLACTGVEWYDNDGAAPPGFTPRPVAPGLVGASSVHPADVDGDGDTDILSVDTANDRVLWFENDGAHPPAWTQRIVTTTVDDPWTVFGSDLDGDGDTDVLAASAEDDRVTWHENDGATPPGWTSHTIVADLDGAIAVCAGDLDSDGDIDVVAGGWWDSRVVWFESDGNAVPSFAEHALGICGGPEAVFTARVDADADVDVLCAANVAGKVFFFENNPGGEVGVGNAPGVGPALHRVSPNPAHGELIVHFSLSDVRPARIEVLDIAGRRVASREVGALGTGEHHLAIGGRLHAGMYVVRLTQGSWTRALRAAVVD